jgi:two-component system chemotaxis response regulator CheB
MFKLNILIIADSPVFRQVLREALTDTNLSVNVIIAKSVSEVNTLVYSTKIDVAIIDSMQTEIDCFLLLKRLMVISSSMKFILLIDEPRYSTKPVYAEAEDDVIRLVSKPPVYISLEKSRQYLTKSFIKEITKLQMGKHPAIRTEEIPEEIVRKKYDTILFASSMGGPDALDVLIPALSPNIGCPILAVQHIPNEFSTKLVQKLSKASRIAVVEGANDMPVESGKVFFAPGGSHMYIERVSTKKYAIKLNQNGYVCGVRPAADVLFMSVAHVMAGKNILVIVMTGMGVDGTEGVAVLKESCNCDVIVQSKETSLIHGMAGSLIENNLADHTLHMENIPGFINRSFGLQ